MINYIGISIGRYHILEQLGQGGMATVFKAYDTRLEREVAIKIIRKEAFPPEQLDKVLKRFEREAKALAKLDHPNIIKVHDYGEYNGSPYLVMYYVQAGTLKEKIGKPIPYQEAAKLLFAISDALSYAHQQGVYHRDVKPSNILITQTGQPILSDFGIAKLLESEETQTLTGTGLGVGTPEYMAPEQGLGKNIDGRADIYALGVVFYEMITGHKPYTADTPMAVIIKQINDPLPRPKETIPTLPDDIEKVLLKALAKNPDDRYQNMREFGKALGVIANRDIQSVDNLRSTKHLVTSTSERHIPEANQVEETRDEFEVLKPNDFPQKQKGAPKRLGWVWIGLFFAFLLVEIIFFFQTGLFSDITAELNKKQENATAIAQTSVAQAVVDEKTATAGVWTPTPRLTLTPSITPTLGLGSVRERGIDGMVQIYIPAGEFEMGLLNGEEDEQPVHTVYTDSYWIDQTEITNLMYTKCVDENVCNPPSQERSKLVSDYYQNPEYENFPVIYVDWNRANKYCEWIDGRLPTEAEWEKAARGSDGRTYPWGNEQPDHSYANYMRLVGDPLAVGSFPDGASPFGVLDMAGNVSEWTASWYTENYETEDLKSLMPAHGSYYTTDSGYFRSVRGGSWISEVEDIGSGSRDYGSPVYSFNTIGFRCVMDSK